MSFLADYFYLDRGSFNSSINQDTFAIHRYFTSDAKEDVEGFGYFPLFFGYDNGTVHTYDHLYVQFLDDSYFEYLIFLDDIGSVSLQLITSEANSESIRVDTNNVGVISFDEIFTFFTLTKQGEFVTLHIPGTGVYVTQVDRVLSFSSLIPDRFLPANNFDFAFPIFVMNQDLWAIGALNITPSGSIYIGVSESYTLYPQRFSVGNIGWGMINVNWSKFIR